MATISSREMSQIVKKIIFIFVIIIVNYECEAARLRNKFVYEKEISEHCLRRVVPSVFLGRQAMDAYSQVLYFSKVDLPYSCFISVRAESGSNIILVVQLLSSEDLKSTCEKDPNQLLVYELGETFGGYWGPQELVKKPQNITSVSTKPNIYTIKHKVKSTKPVSTPGTDVDDSEEFQSFEDKHKLDFPILTAAQDFITIEFPLVNISGQFMPGEEPKESFFEDESFDILYNVRSNPQGAYITTELPLVQFSMDDNSGWGYKEAQNPFGSSWKKYLSHNKYKQKTQNRNIPLKLKLKSPVSRWLHLQNNTTPTSDISGEDDDLSRDDVIVKSKPMRFKDTDKHEADVDIISVEELMSAFNRSGSLTTISEQLEREVSQLLDKLSANNNQSAYIYNPDSETSIEFITTTTNSPFITTSILNDRITTADMQDFGNKILSTATQAHTTVSASSTESIKPEKSVNVAFVKQIVQASMNTLNNTEHVATFSNLLTENTKDLEKKKNKNTITTKGQSIVNPTTAIQKQRRNSSNSATTEPLRPVDHESWENLVRAAPVMAVRLDETMPQKIQDELENNKIDGITIHQETNTENFFKQSNNSKRAKKKRKKRFIQGIMIEDAKPHNLTTKEEMSTTTISSIQISDVQQFAQLVELVDDDIHDRSALRYLSQYVGRPIFNLCQYEQPKPRYVHLFNSSRLVISIGNFTLRKMQLVITPARRLFVGRSRCEQSNLECQVNGNRVCIDAMSACDGVANCGETDIYDEDRLMCGGYVGLRHNVCLAAITFLAVLLTLIYMVHYWLGRCVPKVSEAFFIYTEGDENVLYLDSIMRSPNDLGFVIGKSFDTFDTSALFAAGSKKESKIYSCLTKCLPCFFKKESKDKLDSEEWDMNIQLSPSNTMFSLPELEIHKMMNEEFKDVCIQTGESLEMQYFKSLDKKNKENKATPSEPSVPKSISPVLSIELKRAKDELNRLKFFNKTRKDSLKARTSSSYLDGRQELTKPSSNYEPSRTISSYLDGRQELTKPSSNYEPSRNSLETEIRSLSFEDKTSVKNQRTEISTAADIHTEKQQSKQLRFNEDVVNIPRNDYDSEEEISALQYDGSGKNIIDTIEESEPAVPSTSRDFKRFWVGSKGKKKKKTQMLPRNY